MTDLTPWQFSSPDWEDRLRQGLFPVDTSAARPHLNPRRVAAVHDLMDVIRLPDVPGQPTLTETAAPWFVELAELAAGGLQPDGVQRIHTTGLVIPKKNWKTGGAAALTLMLAMMSPRPRAEFLLLGPEQGTAEISYQAMAGTIMCDDSLRQIFHVRDHLKRIEHRQSGVSITVKAMSMSAVTGRKPAVVLLDELHLWTHRDAQRIMGQLRGGMASIPEAQLIWVSTQSDIPPRGLWAAELHKARQIRDGKLDVEGYLPVIYEPPGEYATSLEAAADPDMWALVNPNLGYSVQADFLVRSFREAVSTGEEETRRWLSQHANVEVSQFGLAEDAWTGASVWERGADPDLTLEDVLAHAPTHLTLGVDGGGLDDLLAITVLTADEDGNWYAWVRAFCYEVVFQRRPGIVSLLRDFEAAGDLVVVADEDGLGPIVDFILDVFPRSWETTIAVDPSGMAAELGQALEHHGISRDRMVAVRQGYGLRPGYQALERRLRNGALIHGSQGIQDWAVSNAQQDGTSGLVTKKVSGAAKIDPLVSLATAAVAAMSAPAPVDIEALVG